MSSIRKTAWIDAPVDQVWATVADVGAVASWFPSIKSSRVDGSIRTCELDRGGSVTEEIVRVDDSLRRLQYRILSGMAVTTHLATVDVIDGEDGRTLVVYSTEIEPDAFGAPIGKSVEVALVSLGRVVVGRREHKSDV